MAFQSAPNMAEAVIQGSMGGKAVYNILNFQKPGGYDETDILALATLVDLWWGTDLVPLLNVGYAYVQTLARGLENLNDYEATVSDTAGSGTVTGGPAGNNAALCLTHRSGLTGRSARGRTYIGGIPASVMLSATTVTTTFVNDIVNAFDNILSVASAAGWVFSVLSRYSGGAPRTTAVHFPIVSIEARNNEIDSQRGRLLTGH